MEPENEKRSSENADKKMPEERTKKIDRLREHIQYSIENTQGKARSNKRRASFIKLASLVTSALVTVLIGWNSAGLEIWLNNIALAGAATVTLLSALEPFFNYRALWVEHEEAAWRFYAVQDDIEFYLAGKEIADVDDAQLDEYHARIRRIWDELSQRWLSFRRGEMDKPKEGVA